MDCFEYGGELVTIEEEKELPYLEKQLESGKGYWMGLNSKLPAEVKTDSDHLEVCMMLTEKRQ